MDDEIRKEPEPANGIEGVVSFYSDSLNVVKPKTYSQRQAESELQMFVKRQVIETW